MNKLLNCTKCGKPLSRSNKYGIFCEDYCELEESKKAAAILDPMIIEIGKVLERRNRETMPEITISDAMREIHSIVAAELEDDFTFTGDEE